MTPDERRVAILIVAGMFSAVFAISVSAPTWGPFVDGLGARGAEIPVVGRTTLPPLRCAQASTFDAKNRPQYMRRVWTQERAEAEVHYLEQSLATARHYGGNAALKSAWALEALAAAELVKLCWGAP